MPYDHDTSGSAYKEKTNRDFCRQQVFITIRKLQPCTDKQISEYINWPINRVTPRRGELVESGLVVQAMKGEDPNSGRLVNWWMIKPVNYQPTLF
jgi:hypothetical protein